MDHTVEPKWNRSDGYQVSRFRIYQQNTLSASFRSGIDAGVKLRPSDEELKDIGPGFQQRWKAYFANAPDKPILWTGIGAL